MLACIQWPYEIAYIKLQYNVHFFHIVCQMWKNMVKTIFSYSSPQLAVHDWAMGSETLGLNQQPTYSSMEQCMGSAVDVLIILYSGVALVLWMNLTCSYLMIWCVSQSIHLIES